MNLPETLQQLDAGATIELFRISTIPIGGSDIFSFHAGTNSVQTSIWWQGIEYQPFPIQADGFDKSTRGTLPRPHLRIANVTGIISAAVIEFDDLVGARVTRHRTFARYLDGQPGADPMQALPNDVFYVEKKISENKVMVEFELTSAMDLAGTQLPSRDIVAQMCSSFYRGTECGYTATVYFNVLNASVGTLAEDVCSKTVAGCKARFLSTGVLPFGGFPAARTFKY
jgi:lambda family phage minor tail protein L